MTTQGAKLMTTFDFMPASNGSSSKDIKAKDGDSFSSMLSNTTAKSVDQTKNLVHTNNKKDSINQVNKDLNQSLAAMDQVNPNEQNVVVATSDNSVSSDIEKVAQLLEDAEEITSKILGLSKEELESKMEILGLSMMDLLNPASLQQLLLDTTGNDDALSLVTNEELANTFSNLLDAVNELVTESLVTQESLETIVKSEEFINFLNQSVSKEEISAMDEAEISLKTVQTENTDETDNLQDAELKEDNIVFTVERSDDTDTSNKDTNSDSKDTLKKNDSPDVNNFLDHVTASVTKTETDFNGELTTVTTVREIANQIIEEIKVVIKPSQTSMELQLNPEHLGKVNLSLTSKEGVMTAQFITQTQAAKEAIESQMQVLKQNLENQGVKVEAIEVNVSNFSFDGSNEAGNKEESGTNKGKKAFRMDIAEGIEDMEDISEVQISLSDETISNVDYSA